jgi:spore cortex formation protein SpoVR/YcgB (stage V sporulation)
MEADHDKTCQLKLQVGYDSKKVNPEQILELLNQIVDAYQYQSDPQLEQEHYPSFEHFRASSIKPKYVRFQITVQYNSDNCDPGSLCLLLDSFIEKGREKFRKQFEQLGGIDVGTTHLNFRK